MFWAKFLMAMARTRCLFIKGISRNVCRGKTFYLQTKKSFLVWKYGVLAEYFALGNQVAGFYYYHFFAEQNQHRHASAFPIFFQGNPIQLGSAIFNLWLRLLLSILDVRADILPPLQIDTALQNNSNISLILSTFLKIQESFLRENWYT